MTAFSNRWPDFRDYIIDITKEIWEDRGIGTLNHYYAPDIPVRSPMGVSRGNQAVIAATMATVKLIFEGNSLTIKHLKVGILREFLVRENTQDH